MSSFPGFNLRGFTLAADLWEEKESAQPEGGEVTDANKESDFSAEGFTVPLHLRTNPKVSSLLLQYFSERTTLLDQFVADYANTTGSIGLALQDAFEREQRCQRTWEVTVSKLLGREVRKREAPAEGDAEEGTQKTV